MNLVTRETRANVILRVQRGNPLPPFDLAVTCARVYADRQ
jgi:hypothetical protein